MELTQAQADKINDILGVSFVDLEEDADAQQYLDALEDGECLASLFPSDTAGEEDEVSEEEAAVQAASEEAHSFLTNLLENYTEEQMIRDELTELVEEHGFEAIERIFRGVNLAEESYAKIVGRTHEWGTECVKEFFDSYYKKTYATPDGEGMNENAIIIDENTIIIEGEHGLLAFHSVPGHFMDLYFDYLYKAFM